MENVLKTLTVFVSAIVSYLWGGWSDLLKLLLTAVFIDYATGFAAGWMEGKLKSAVGFKGIARKIGIFVMVGVAYLVDRVMGDGTMLRDAAILFYMANEVLSIMENIGRIGLPMPPGMKQAIDILKGKAGEKNDKSA